VEKKFVLIGKLVAINAIFSIQLSHRAMLLVFPKDSVL
jgi:hypothetical protein